jgi:hypothetical protein
MKVESETKQSRGESLAAGSAYESRPCGSYEWEVVRAGADIGQKCLKCQRRVLLERGVFERRVKNLSPKVTNYSFATIKSILQ